MLFRSLIEAKVQAAQAKRDTGSPLNTMDWFWLAVGASGLGAGGVATGKAALRKLLGLRVKIDPESLPDHLQEPPKPS